MRKTNILLFLIIGLLITSCARNSQVKSTVLEENTPKINDLVAVFPFVRVETEESMARCPVTNDLVESCSIASHAESTLSMLLASALDLRPEIQRVPMSLINEEIDKLSLEEKVGLGWYGAIQRKIGKSVHAGTALFGIVFCFKDRSGNAYATQEPAEVGFCLYLSDVDTGKILWKACFYDKQKPLSENLLEARTFLERKGQWITAGQLAQEGLKDMVSDIPITINGADK